MKNHSTLVLLCKRRAKIKNKNRKPLIKNDLRFFVVTRVGLKPTTFRTGIYHSKQHNNLQYCILQIIKKHICETTAKLLLFCFNKIRHNSTFKIISAEIL